MTYWLNGEAFVVQDSEKDPVYQFTNANVIDGTFAYEGTPLKTRINACQVSWNDPNDYYRKRVEHVELEETLQRDDEFVNLTLLLLLVVPLEDKQERLGSGDFSLIIYIQILSHLTHQLTRHLLNRVTYFKSMTNIKMVSHGAEEYQVAVQQLQ